MPKNQPNDDKEDEDIGRAPLTISERKTLRRIIENEERLQWFWGSVRIWAGWITGVIVGSWAVVEIIRKIWTKNY